jgi:hypothetical protein
VRPKNEDEGTQESASPLQAGKNRDSEIPAELVDSSGDGEWTRTTDLRIMSDSPRTDNKEDHQLSPAECGKIQQNPQARRKLGGKEK